MKKPSIIHRIGTAFLAAAVCVTSIFGNGNALKAEAAEAGDKDVSQIQPITVNSSFDSVPEGLIAWHYRTYSGDYCDFCLERGKQADRGYNYTAVKGYMSSIGLTEAAYYYIALAEYYGYPNEAQYKLRDTNMYKDTDLYVATQVVIWEILGGYRNIPYNSLDSESIDTASFATRLNDKYYNEIIKKMYPSGKTNLCEQIYNNIVTKIAKHSQRPSFGGTEAEPTLHTMTFDPQHNQWKLTLTDTNGQLANFSDLVSKIQAQGYNASISGNTLTITAPVSKQGKSQPIVSKKDWAFSSVDTPLVWHNDTYQDTMPVPTVGQADPITAGLMLQTPDVYGKVVVTKTSSQNSNTKLQGAQFEISYAEAYTDPTGTSHAAGEVFTTITTGADGVAETSAIREKMFVDAKYSIKEVKSPDGYIINSTPTAFEFNLDTDEYTSNRDFVLKKFNPTNAPTETHVSKKAATGDAELVGAHLQLYEGSSKIDEWDSTSEQHIIYGLKFGTEYTLKETIAPDGFKVATDKTFRINDDGSVTHVTMIDDYKTGEISVQKRTEEMINLAGIKFNLSGTSQVGVQVNQSATTNANGLAKFQNVPIGTYSITEDGSTVPVGYLVAEPQSVTVYDAQTSNVEFFNDYKSGSISVQKRTEGGNDLSGIKFILSGTADIGLPVNKTATTDENGVATFTHIPVGSYTIAEDDSTVPAAYLTADPQTVSVEYAQTAEAEFFNETKKGDIQIQKRTEGGNDLSGIKFILSGTSDAGTDVKAEAATDESGKATFTHIPVGSYTITEDGSTVPTAYLVADPQTVSVEYAQTAEVEIFNETRKGNIKLQKRTDGMVYVSGIKFVLTGTSDAGTEINLEAITDNDGVARFSEVPVGTYTITEDGSTVPTGFMTADPQEVKVVYAQSSEIEFYNKPNSGDNVPKTGSEKPQNSVPTGAFGAVALAATAAVLVALKRKKNS